jgi:hypothetical protein
MRWVRHPPTVVCRPPDTFLFLPSVHCRLPECMAVVLQENEDFADYYAGIVGDMERCVSCRIVARTLTWLCPPRDAIDIESDRDQVARSLDEHDPDLPLEAPVPPTPHFSLHFSLPNTDPRVDPSFCGTLDIVALTPGHGRAWTWSPYPPRIPSESSPSPVQV